MRTITLSVPSTRAEVTASLRDSVTKARRGLALGLLRTAKLALAAASKLNVKE